MPQLVASDWYVTAEKVQEAVRRLIEQVDPLAIIAFGSRARGTHREDSDLDLALILEPSEQSIMDRVPPEIFAGLQMPVDMLPVTKDRHDEFRPWAGSVHHHIDHEGIVLFARGGQPAGMKVLEHLCCCPVTSDLA